MGHDMDHRIIRKLSDLEIDEVSLVDRPANQHGLVAFAKRQEDSMGKLYDAAGAEVTEDELEHGDFVYGEDGSEFQFVLENPDDGTTAGLDDEYEFDADDELALQGLLEEDSLVGKDARTRVASGLYRMGAAGGRAREGASALRAGADEYLAAGGVRARAGRGARNAPGRVDRFGRRPSGLSNRRVAGGVAGAGAVGYGSGRVGKSLGQSVLEDLSKAFTEGDRDQVIAKAMDRVSKAEQRAALLEDAVLDLTAERELEQYTEVAKSYGLPGDPNMLARILQNAVATMGDDEIDELDRLLMSQGEIYKALGTDLGGQDSDTHASIEALADQIVGKSDLSREQAIVAAYGANPAAYDDYLMGE